MSFPPPSLLPLAERVVSLLKQRKETLALVETATGGLIASTILSFPGTSAVFAGGVLAYQLQVREKFLPGWKDGLDKEYDGPNEQIVFSLASSLSRQLPSATYVLAESGVAGPGLSPSYRSEIDSPGYCPLAIVGKGLGEQGVRKTLRVPQDEFEEGKERAGNMVKFSEAALEMVLDVLEKK